MVTAPVHPGSRRRAGAYARRRSRDLQLDFLRRNYRYLIAAIGTAGLVVLAFQFMLEGILKGAFIGGTAAAVLGFVWHFVIIYSGSTASLMGEQGEVWTHEELRKVTKLNWKVAHGVRIRGFGDIDTVAIGPGGVVVLETKWSSEPWQSPNRRERIEGAVRHVSREAPTVRNMLKHRVGDTPAHGVVVLWPAHFEPPTTSAAGVTVLRGSDVAEWLSALPTVLSEGEISQGWDVLVSHIRKRDDADGLPPMTAAEYFGAAAEYFAGGLAGAFAFTGLLALFDTAGLGLAIGFLATSFTARRVTRVRRVATGAFTVSLAVSAVLFVLVAQHLFAA